MDVLANHFIQKVSLLISFCDQRLQLRYTLLKYLLLLLELGALLFVSIDCSLQILDLIMKLFELSSQVLLLLGQPI